MISEKLNYNVAICALARDCEAELKNNIPQIENLRQLFKSSVVVVVENDSKDETKSVLANWAAISKNVSVISNDYDTLTIPKPSEEITHPETSMHRIEKMAFYRNIYLNWIEQQSQNFDLIIMLDIDVLSFSVEGVQKAIISAPNNWGGIFANGYTDTKIFGRKVYSMFHDMYAYIEILPSNKPYLTVAKLFSQKKLMNKRLSEKEYLPVVSSFGGMGIYKFNAIKGLRYKAERNEDKYMEAVCEHITFNMAMISRGYHAFICRSLNVYYGKSQPLIALRNIMPLYMFKALCLLVKFKKLKE
jgi:glycosyltransferase involved in cell wall biosynthesis